MSNRAPIWITAIVLAASVTGGSAQQAADTIIYNAKVLTVDSKFSTAQAVAVHADRIVAVGTNDDVLKLAGPQTLKLDVKGHTVIPGLINTHVHLEYVLGYADELGARKSRIFPLNVRGLKTKDAVLQQIRDAIAAFKIPPGEWMFFDPNWTASQAPIIFRDLNAKELDKAAPKNPIVINPGMTPENINMVNGVAIRELWRKYKPFLEAYGRYWIDPQGEPSGILEPPASRLAWEDDEFVGLNPKIEDVAPYFRKILLENYSSVGITTLSGALNTSTVEAYQWLDKRGEMPLRYAYGAMAGFHPGKDITQFKPGAGTPDVFVASVSARAVDGGGTRMCVDLPRNNDAVLSAAGQGDSSDLNRVATEWFPRGQCDMDIEYKGGGGGGANGARIHRNYYTEWYQMVADNGLRSSNAHVSGDRTISLMIDAFQKIDRQRPGAVKGWSFDHCNLVNPKDIPRAAKLGLMFSCNPTNAVASDTSRGARSPLVSFGAKVLDTYAAPFKAMIDAGINVSMEMEQGMVWDGVRIMVTRKDFQGKVWGDHLKVDRQTALRIATQNGANYIVKGDQLGSIQTGKLADLVLLDKDYMTIPEDDIATIRPLFTMKGGKMVFVRTDFSDEYGLKPPGAEISTYEALQKRRPSNETRGGG